MLLKSVTMGITAMHTYDKCSISKKITGRTIAMLPATSAVTFGFDVLVGNCWTIDATSHASGGADNGFWTAREATHPDTGRIARPLKRLIISWRALEPGLA